MSGVPGPAKFHRNPGEAITANMSFWFVAIAAGDGPLAAAAVTGAAL